MTYDSSSRELAYRVTNESLEAIVHGLNPQEEDSILAICGSGDQAFALLEKAKRIVVVDNQPKQIGYFVKRKSLLKVGEFEKFLDTGERLKANIHLRDLKIRNRYFSKARLEVIQPKLKDSWRMKRISGNLFDLRFEDGEFNKIYLSNVLTYALEAKTIELAQERLRAIAQWVSGSGLIYVSDYGRIIERASNYANDEEFLRPLDLRIDEKLTSEARRLQSESKQCPYWKPAVLQKVA